MIKINQETLSDMMFGMGNPGVCLECGEVDEYAGCEPDARNYECPSCGEPNLFGLEEALMMGELDVT